MSDGLASNDPLLQQGAAQCLADLEPGPQSAGLLLPKIMDRIGEDDPQVRQSALEALEALVGKAGAGRILSGALENERTRPFAVAAAARLGPRAAQSLPALKAVLSDARPDLRKQAALAISAIGPGAAEATSALVDALDDQDAAVQRAAATALGSIGPAAKSAAAPLQALIAKDNAATDLAAACALASIAPGDARSAQLAMPVLIAGVDADRAVSRRAAAEALGKFGAAASSGLPALQYAAEDPDPGVRSAARDAIAQIGK